MPIYIFQNPDTDTILAVDGDREKLTTRIGEIVSADIEGRTRANTVMWELQHNLQQALDDANAKDDLIETEVREFDKAYKLSVIKNDKRLIELVTINAQNLDAYCEPTTIMAQGDTITSLVNDLHNRIMAANQEVTQTVSVDTLNGILETTEAQHTAHKPNHVTNYDNDCGGVELIALNTKDIEGSND